MIEEKREIGYSYDAGCGDILSRKEEHILGLRILDGDGEAINELAVANMRYVVKEANKLAGKYGIPARDLYQEGFIHGLLKAARKYDTEKGYRFLTYASYWVKHAFLSYIKRLGKNVDANSESLFAEAHCSSDATERELIDVLPNDDSPDPQALMEIMELRESVRRLIETADLKEKELSVVSRLFGLNGSKQRTVEEVAKKLNISRSKVKVINAKALWKIRRAAGE